MHIVNTQSGLLTPVYFIPSPNINDRPKNTDIDLLIIHGISLPPGEYGGNAITQLFTNQLDPTEHEYFEEIADLTVSSHLLIRRTGIVLQYVPFSKCAWHAGVSVFQGRESCNDYSIGIELEGTDNEDYTKEQYNELIKISKVLIASYPGITIDRIVGHSDVAPGRKTDPGPAFNWNYFREAVAASSSP